MPLQPKQRDNRSAVHSSDKPAFESLSAFASPDRRCEQKPGPPWQTEEGVVLEERRSGLDRRAEK